LKVGGYKNVRVGSGTSLVEIKTGSKWVHLADLHGTDMPELMLKGSPYGFETQPTKTFMVEGKTIAGQKLGQSLTEKGGSVLTAHINPKGQIYFSPEAHRIKDVADFVSVAERLNVKDSVKLTKDITSLKGLLKTNFPEVSFTGGTEVFASISTPPPSKLPVLSLATASWSGVSAVGTPSPIGSKSLNVQIAKALKSPSVQSITTSSYVSKVSKVSSYVSPSRVSKGSSYVTPSWSAVSPSMSVSPSVSVSPSGSVSMSPSPSPSRSPSPSPSPSPSVSPSMSPSPSPSPYYFQAPVVVPPIPPIFPFFDLSGGGWDEGKGTGKKKKRITYTPDFTARALGLSMGKKSKKQLKKMLDTEFTGLEVRGSWQ
jgi:hypothetical protein